MTLLKLVGFVWLLPMTIPFWLFYILPLLWRDIRFRGFAGFGVARFELVSRHSRYARMWKNWAGFSGPCCILHRAGLSKRDLAVTIAHEHRHCMQQLVFGPFFYPLYVLCSAAIWVYATIANEQYHAYLDNPFERDARRAAGQPVRIPPDRWPGGPEDRWPWW